MKKAVTCSIEECKQKAVARGLCNMHYSRFQRHGNPNTVNRNRISHHKSLKAYLKSRMLQVGSCIEWRGPFDKGGYGVLRLDGKNYRAARLVYSEFVKPIPDGLFICHACDNPRCVNTGHLWLGTQSDNMQDAARKGRVNNPVPRKLSADEAQFCRNLYTGAVGELTAIAKQFDVSIECIRNIILNKTYKDI